MKNERQTRCCFALTRPLSIATRVLFRRAIVVEPVAARFQNALR